MKLKINKFFTQKKRNFFVVFFLIFSIVTTATMAFLYAPKIKNALNHSKQISDLENRLQEYNISFIAASIPTLQRTKRSGIFDLPYLRSRFTGFLSLLTLRIKDTPLLDFRQAFSEVSSEKGNFPDNYHLSNNGIIILGRAAHKQLQDFFKINNVTFPKTIVIVGDCYSEDLASGLELADPATKYIAARAYGNPLTAMELPFKFPSTYIKNTDFIIWLRPESIISYQPPPDLDFTPLKATAGKVEKQLKVLSDIGYTSETFRSQVYPKLEYPDANAEITAETLDETVIIISGQATTARQPTGFETIRKGDSIVAILQEFDSYLAENPKQAGAYYIRTEENYSSPRYRVHAWEKIKPIHSKYK